MHTNSSNKGRGEGRRQLLVALFQDTLGPSALFLKELGLGCRHRGQEVRREGAFSGL